jgi:hypothetical protein
MARKNDGPAPALRVCDACGQVDDGPRHTLLGGDPNTPGRVEGVDVVDLLLDQGYDQATVKLAMRQVDEAGLYLHLDCCRAIGCPDGLCDRQTAGAEDLRDDDLRDHLMSLGPNNPED